MTALKMYSFTITMAVKVSNLAVTHRGRTDLEFPSKVMYI
jgi:hypothetical protein